MTHPGLSNSDMSTENYGIPTPPANDNSDAKNSFFQNSDLTSVKVVEKRKDAMNDITDASSDHSSPSTPEPIQSHSKVRYYITDQKILPSLIARIAESNNIKLPESSPSPYNYGDLSVSTAPSVCGSVSSSVPDLSDSASTPTSPDEDSSDSVATATISSTDQSRLVTSNVTSVPCSTSSSSRSAVTSPTNVVNNVNPSNNVSSIASYSVRLLQKISTSSSDVNSSTLNNNNNISKTMTDRNDENVTSTENPIKTSIANAIKTASAAPRTVHIPNRSARRSKRKGIPYKSPSHEDLLREPGFVFSFPVVFNNALPTCNHSSSDGSDQNETSKEVSSELGSNTINITNTTSTTTTTTTTSTTSTTTTNSSSSSTTVITSSESSHNVPKSRDISIIHRPLLLPDIVRSLNQARRSKLRTRPVTRAKNKRENQELDMFKLGLEHMIDSQSNSAAIEEAKARKRRIATVGRPSKKSILLSTGSQIPRSSNSGENKSPRGSSICSTSSSSSAAAAFYRIPSKRRDSMSVSSLSSIPPSELSDFDLNSDNFGDDEDDPDFAPPAKKRKPEVQRGSKTVGRKESNSKVKVCASCRTKSTPCWRPGWSTDLMLCNSCGLRYKKTKCVCVNPECRYIPLKSEYNAMFKKPKNGDTPDLKRCCKCQTPL